jgi:hypothetical protein
MTIGYDIYNGAFSIVSKHDFDDQFFLLATVLTHYFFDFNCLLLLL